MSAFVFLFSFFAGLLVSSQYYLYTVFDSRRKNRYGNTGHPDAGLFGELEVLAYGYHEL